MQDEGSAVRTALEALTEPIRNLDQHRVLQFILEANEALCDAGFDLEFTMEDSYPHLVSVREVD